MADLSRSAQQVLDEAWGSPWDADDLDLADVEVIVAYALRGAALYCTRDRLILLALAEELEGRDALAQPEPQGPTDEEILALSQGHGVSYTMCDGGVIYGRREGYDMRDDVLSFARAVLARWGNR